MEVPKHPVKTTLMLLLTLSKTMADPRSTLITWGLLSRIFLSHVLQSFSHSHELLCKLGCKCLLQKGCKCKRSATASEEEPKNILHAVTSNTNFRGVKNNYRQAFVGSASLHILIARQKLVLLAAWKDQHLNGRDFPVNNLTFSPTGLILHSSPPLCWQGRQ